MTAQFCVECGTSLEPTLARSVQQQLHKPLRKIRRWRWLRNILVVIALGAALYQGLRFFGVIKEMRAAETQLQDK